MQNIPYTENSPLLCRWEPKPNTQTIDGREAQPQNMNGSAYRNHLGKLVVIHPHEGTEIPIDESKIECLMEGLWRYNGKLIL